MNEQALQQPQARSVAIKCGVCDAKEVATVAEGRIMGNGIRWLRMPPGWWVFLPAAAYDIQDPEVSLGARCPMHLLPELVQHETDMRSSRALDYIMSLTERVHALRTSLIKISKEDCWDASATAREAMDSDDAAMDAHMARRSS